MKNQFYKSQEVIEAKISILQRGGLFSALAMTALATALGLASSTSVVAQPFLSSPCADGSITFACFQITVDTVHNPNVAFLLNANGGLAAYPGWASPYLTSPGLQDDPSSSPGQTVIGESAGLPAPPTISGYPGGGIQIGMTTPTVCGSSLEQYSMPLSGPSGFTSYAYPGLGWQYPKGASDPTSTTLTEIQYFTLTSQFSTKGSGGCPPGTSYLYPATTTSPATSIFVKAGYQNLLDPARRSIGMIVSHNNDSGTTPAGNDFPAESFFDVFVEVTLPAIAIPSTESAVAFPSGGAKLINTAPLIVTTDPLNSFPSNGIFYVHSPATPPVTLVFEYDNPDPNSPGDGNPNPYWWHKGDPFGQIQLAGHGFFNPCAKSTINWDSFMAAVLGTPGHRQPAAAMSGLFPGSEYPWTTCSYSMTRGTNFGGQAWDAITFSNATTISAAFLTVSNFQMPVSLPTFGNSVTYTNTNTIFDVSWSLNGLTNYVQDQSTGTVVVQISNTNMPVNGVTTYNTTLLQCSLAGLADFGQWALQLDPSKPSTGLHMVQALFRGGYQIAGYFDARFQVSANGGVTWTESDAPNRLYLGDSPCGAGIEPIHCTRSGSNVILDWANPSYSLQGSTSLSPASWVPIASGSPAILPINTPYKFFQLTCD